MCTFPYPPSTTVICMYEKTEKLLLSQLWVNAGPAMTSKRPKQLGKAIWNIFKSVLIHFKSNFKETQAQYWANSNFDFFSGDFIFY